MTISGSLEPLKVNAKIRGILRFVLFIHNRKEKGMAEIVLALNINGIVSKNSNWHGHILEILPTCPTNKRLVSQKMYIK